MHASLSNKINTSHLLCPLRHFHSDQCSLLYKLTQNLQIRITIKCIQLYGCISNTSEASRLCTPRESNLKFYTTCINYRNLRENIWTKKHNSSQMLCSMFVKFSNLSCTNVNEILITSCLLLFVNLSALTGEIKISIKTMWK